MLVTTALVGALVLVNAPKLRGTRSAGGRTPAHVAPLGSSSDGVTTQIETHLVHRHPVHHCLVGANLQGSIVHLAGSSPYEHSLRHNFRTANTAGAKPVLIAVVGDARDVQRVVRCARATGLKVCTRSGGGSFMGASLCSKEPAVLLDLHKLKNITYDQATGSVKAEMGLTLGQALYHVNTQSGGSATLPVGLCLGIGLGGYLLGGGMGPIDGQAGLLCDRLQAVDMVTAEGQLVTATKEFKPELLWAACGAGGQALGVVVSVVLDTYPARHVDDSVCARVEFGAGEAAETFARWQSYVQHRAHLRFDIGSNGKVSLWGCFWNTTLERFDFGRVTGISGGRAVFLHEFHRFLDAQKFLGPHGGWGTREVAETDEQALVESQWFFARQQDTRTVKSMLIEEVFPTAPGMAAALDLCCRGPEGGWSVCTFIPVGEAVNAKAPDETAVHWRSAKFSVEITAADTEDTKRREWAGSVYSNLESAARKLGTYVNYPDEDLLGYHREYWGHNYPRLQDLKAVYDPHVIFDAPHGIVPQCANCSVWI